MLLIFGHFQNMIALHSMLRGVIRLRQQHTGGRPELDPPRSKLIGQITRTQSRIIQFLGSVASTLPNHRHTNPSPAFLHFDSRETLAHRTSASNFVSLADLSRASSCGSKGGHET
jgi:hypothetical protein